MATYVISPSRSGIGGVVVSETSTKTYVISNIGVVIEASAPSAFSQTLTDNITGSETLVGSFPVTTNLSDSISSSDTFVPIITLRDSISSFDAFVIPIFASLIDSISVSDTVIVVEGEITGFSDNIIVSDNISVQTAFSPAFSDMVLSFDTYDGITTIGPILECGPIPIFPLLPQGFPVKLSLVMDTTVGTTKSLREMRVAQQVYPLWDIELLFEELLDQTQNQTPYLPFSGFQQYEELVQLFLMMYGQTGIFAFDAPWDDSRTDQYIATGDGTTQDFPIFRTWGTGSIATSAPIGLVDAVTNVKINGTIVNPTSYSFTRSYIDFTSPPSNGAIVTMTFSYYYICRFVEDEQNFEEFSKNRWAVPSLKFRAVYWPGCQ